MTAGVTMPYDPTESYFAAGNVASGFFITPDEWQLNLFHNLLLRPRIQLLDAALIADYRVANHLTDPERPGGESWLEVGLNEKIVIPRLRTKSFRDLATDLADRGFVGVDRRIDTVVKCVERTQYEARPWPDDLGSSYQKMLRSEVSSGVPGYYDTLHHHEVADRLLTFWEDRRIWRTEWLEQAADFTRESENTGVRISDVAKVAYQSLGIQLPESPSVAHLLETAKTAHPELSEDLMIFFKILCELHNRNAALRFECLSNSLNLDWISAAVTFGWTRSASGELELCPLATLEVPTLGEFRRTPGHVLKHLREHNVGQQYFADFTAWSKEPTETHLAKLATSLEAYGRFVCKTIAPSAPRIQRHILGTRGVDILSFFVGAYIWKVYQTPVPLIMASARLVIAESLEVLRRGRDMPRDRIVVRIEDAAPAAQVPELTGVPTQSQ